MPIPKKLPDMLLPQEPEEQALEKLVNEIPEKLVNESGEESGEETIESLKKKLLSCKQSMNNLKGEYNKMSAKHERQERNYSDVSRHFRIFLSIVTGLVSRGMFDPTTLKPGSEVNLMKHAAGLAEVANAAARERKF